MIIMIITKRSCNYFTNAYPSCANHAMYVHMFVFHCALFCMWSCVDIGKTCSHWLSNKMFEFELSLSLVYGGRGIKTVPFLHWFYVLWYYRYKDGTVSVLIVPGCVIYGTGTVLFLYCHKISNRYGFHTEYQYSVGAGFGHGSINPAPLQACPTNQDLKKM